MSLGAPVLAAQLDHLSRETFSCCGMGACVQFMLAVVRSQGENGVAR